MDYLSSQSNSLGYALSVERLLGLEMPDRVKWIRVLLAELQRINSHLVFLGTHAMELGAVSVMLYTFRERELILNINELIAGFRMFPSYIRVGGLREDLPEGFHEAVTTVLDRMPGKIDEYEKLLTKNAIYKRRTRGIGALTADEALGLGLVGPIARASGSTYDVRKAFPYCGYETFDFDCPDGQPRRRVRPVHRADGGDAAERPHLPPGARADHAGRDVGRRRSPRRAAAQGPRLHRDGGAHPALPDPLAGLRRAGRRGVRAGRRPSRRTWLLRRVRRGEPPLRA